MYLVAVLFEFLNFIYSMYCRVCILYSIVMYFVLAFSGIWFIFATNWAFMLLAVTNILHAVIVVQHYFGESNNGKLGNGRIPFLFLVDLSSGLLS